MDIVEEMKVKYTGVSALGRASMETLEDIKKLIEEVEKLRDDITQQNVTDVELLQCRIDSLTKELTCCQESEADLDNLTDINDEVIKKLEAENAELQQRKSDCVNLGALAHDRGEEIKELKAKYKPNLNFEGPQSEDFL